MSFFIRPSFFLSEAHHTAMWEALLASTGPLRASLPPRPARPLLHPSWDVPPGSGPPSGRGSLGVTAGALQCPPPASLAASSRASLPHPWSVFPEELLLFAAFPHTRSSCPDTHERMAGTGERLLPRGSRWLVSALGRAGSCRRAEASLSMSLLLCLQLPEGCLAQEPVPECVQWACVLQGPAPC